MRTIINKRAAAVLCGSDSVSASEHSEAEAGTGTKETELICDCSLTEELLSSSESDAMLT